MSKAVFPDLAKKIKTQYAAAHKSGELIFTESEIHDVGVNGINFEIRCAPALQKKPTRDPSSEDGKKAQKKDPLEPPYIPDLLVAEEELKEEGEEAGEGFAVLLNKFSIVQRHFLLVTREFVPQTTPFTPLELFAAYSILKQLGSREKHLCFYNSGPESGASQPHKQFGSLAVEKAAKQITLRHRSFQFVPLSNGIAPFDEFIDAHKPEKPSTPFQMPLPYANFTTLLSPPSSPTDQPAYFLRMYMSLMDLLIEHLRVLASKHVNDFGNIKLSKLSFNVIFTERYLQLVPRLRENYTLDGDRGEVSINALGFAGYILTKSEEALEGIKTAGPINVLQHLAFPPVFDGEKAVEAELA